MPLHFYNFYLKYLQSMTNSHVNCVKKIKNKEKKISIRKSQQKDETAVNKNQSIENLVRKQECFIIRIFKAYIAELSVVWLLNFPAALDQTQPTVYDTACISYFLVKAIGEKIDLTILLSMKPQTLILFTARIHCLSFRGLWDLECGIPTKHAKDLAQLTQQHMYIYMNQVSSTCPLLNFSRQGCKAFESRSCVNIKALFAVSRVYPSLCVAHIPDR